MRCIVANNLLQLTAQIFSQVAAEANVHNANLSVAVKDDGLGNCIHAKERRDLSATIEHNSQIEPRFVDIAFHFLRVFIQIDRHEFDTTGMKLGRNF